MAQFTLQDYFQTYIPDVATLMPSYNIAAALNGAMALYWTYLFPEDVPPITLDETRLDERQKVMIALRAAISVIGVVNKLFSGRVLAKAGAGPAQVEFQNVSSLYKVLLPLWTEELVMYEAAENVFFQQEPIPPAYLQSIVSGDCWPSEGYIVQAGAYFIKDC